MLFFTGKLRRSRSKLPLRGHACRQAGKFLRHPSASQSLICNHVLMHARRRTDNFPRRRSASQRIIRITCSCPHAERRTPSPMQQRRLMHDAQSCGHACREAGNFPRHPRASAEGYASPPPLGASRRSSFVDGLRGFIAPAMASPQSLESAGRRSSNQSIEAAGRRSSGQNAGHRRSSEEGLGIKPPAFGAAAKHGSFFLGRCITALSGEIPACSDYLDLLRTFEGG